MRLIRQVTLFLREGTSDKVYEVDLCEAGEGEFVVNFRYGRRGTTLREGTKTTFPVSRAEAEDVYEKLVASKTTKGYATTLPAAGEEPERPRPTANDPRARRVLRYLKAAALGNDAPSDDWSLSRILWRVGEMGLREAAPYLAKMTADGDDMHDVSLAWALGRCGDESCTAALRSLLATTKSAPAKRFAEAALLDLSDPADREDLLGRQIAALPASVAAVLYGAPQDVISALQEALQRTEGPQEVLFHLYMISPYIAGARVAVIEALRRLPFGPNTFQPVRRIYKLAEFRGDGEVFGLLAYRFEKTQESYRRSQSVLRLDGVWHSVADLLRRSDSRLAYSQGTRAYLRERSIRTLTRLGELGLDLYAEMATGVLLAFDDEFDRKRPRTTTQYIWERSGRYQTIETYFDVYDYPLLNHLLYANSTRYVPKKGLKGWPCAGTYRPGQPAPEGREEAFPKIWDRNPRAIIKLLRESSCLPVHEFAVKVFRANPQFAERVDVGDLIDILTRPYEITARLAIDLAQRLYDPSQPNLGLVSGLATCASEAGRSLALGWIGEQPGVFLRDVDFLLKILFTQYADVHAAIRRWVAEVGVEGETLRVVALAAVDRLLSLDVRPGNSELTRLVGETLLAIAREPLSRIEIAILLLMLNHPLDEVQALGGRLLVNHETPATQLDEQVFDKLINATSAAARRAGVELFGSLPDEVLLERQATIATFATSKRPEFRESVRPIIARLAARDEEFARGMVEQLYPLLARKERYEGFHGDVYQLLVEPLGAHLSIIPREHIDKLLDSKYERAQELGARLLESQVTPSHVPMRRLVRLGSHEALSVRAWVRRAYSDDPERVKRELEESIRLVDSTWDDSRDFAFDFFRTQLAESDWKPEVLVAVADSTNKAVQSFGRELITRFFDEQHGQTYLLRLSQHPSPDLQLFATNYLERFAAGHDDRIESLELFFITVLCQVNRGRVAKDRILAFLRKEALRSEATARLVARILIRQSATLAIGDKAACIETLRSIEGVYPQIETPLRVRKPPVRGIH